MADIPQQSELHRIERDYQRDLTITTARPRVVQFALVFWLLLDIGLIIFFLLSVVLYLVSGSFTDQRLVGTLDNNVEALHGAAAARLADPLLVGDARVLTHDVGQYDVYATIENPNAEWYATFTYMLSDGVMDTPVAAVVMPGEEKYLLALHIESTAKPSGVTVNVDNVVWHRVDRHRVPNTAEFLTEHENFVVTDSAYDDTIVVDTTKVGDSSFLLQNNTPYSYYNPTFVVLLTHGGSVVAINQVTVPQFAANDVREVSVHWFGSAPGSGAVEVIPSINYFDADAYAAPTGSIDEDIRDTSGDRRR